MREIGLTDKSTSSVVLVKKFFRLRFKWMSLYVYRIYTLDYLKLFICVETGCGLGSVSCESNGDFQGTQGRSVRVDEDYPLIRIKIVISNRIR